MTNRKSYSGFPTSHQPRFYAAPNFLKMGINYRNLSSIGHFDNKGRKVCCKVLLYKNSQRRSCSGMNCLSSGINILAGGSSVPLLSERKGTDPHWKHLYTLDTLLLIARQPWRHCVTSLCSAYWLASILELAARCSVSGCWPSCYNGCSYGIAGVGILTFAAIRAGRQRPLSSSALMCHCCRFPVNLSWLVPLYISRWNSRSSRRQRNSGRRLLPCTT